MAVCAAAVVAMVCGACAIAPAATVLPYRAPQADNARAVAASISMCDVPRGVYSMGSDEDGYQNGYPRHTVSVGAFQMACYDVTFAQFDAFVRAQGRPAPPDEGWGRGSRPVINVDWAQIREFIAWVNAGSRHHFRLPSEAEWEYAARAGTSTAYWWGDDPSAEYANTAANTGRDVWEFTSPVGSFPANPFGLYDMLGNVWQVVQDCRHLTYVGAPADGSVWPQAEVCDSHVVRGGYFGSLRIGMRCSTRGAAGEDFHSMGLGFRLAEDRLPGRHQAGR